MTNSSRTAIFARRAPKAFRQGLKWLLQPPRQTRVIFLSGVQRSGTNMIMDLLDLSPDTQIFDEDDSRAFVEFQLKDNATVHRLARSLFPCVVFKTLCDAEKVRSFLDSFPDAAAIWMYRHYNGVIASHLARWPGIRNQLENLVVNRASVGWRGRGMSDETWNIVRKHFRPDLSASSAVALFWYYRNQLFFDQALETDSRTRLLKYENVVSTPVSQVSELCEFLQIRSNLRMTASVMPDSMASKTPDPIDPNVQNLCESIWDRLEKTRLQIGLA